ncbi:MAG: type II toxin-antitoxin system RelE/ParE family toxin [Sphingomonadales bacterium]|jgi:toxin ParE1/3/4
MAVLDVTSAARADLDALIDDGAARFGPDAALAYAETIATALRRLETFPQSAPEVEWRADGVRKLTIGQHLAFYRIEGDVVRILRILHQRMEPARHL